MFTLVFWALLTMNVRFLCLSCKKINVPFYKCTITATARDCDPQGGEMYQITLDLKQKPATIEHFFSLKENNH